VQVKGSLEEEEEEEGSCPRGRRRIPAEQKLFLLIKAENQFKPCGRTRAQ